MAETGEEKKQILYLLGPVGGGKSSLAEKLKSLMEKESFYALKHKDDVSPLFESTLGLFEPEKYAKQFNMPPHNVIHKSDLINIVKDPKFIDRMRFIKRISIDSIQDILRELRAVIAAR